MSITTTQFYTVASSCLAIFSSFEYKIILHHLRNPKISLIISGLKETKRKTDINHVRDGGWGRSKMSASEALRTPVGRSVCAWPFATRYIAKQQCQSSYVVGEERHCSARNNCAIRCVPARYANSLYGFSFDAGENARWRETILVICILSQLEFTRLR